MAQVWNESYSSVNAYSDYKQAGRGEEVDGTCSEDDSSLPKGLRRTQSVKMSRAKVVRKEVCVLKNFLSGARSVCSSIIHCPINLKCISLIPYYSVCV